MLPHRLMSDKDTDSFARNGSTNSWCGNRKTSADSTK